MEGIYDKYLVLVPRIEVAKRLMEKMQYVYGDQIVNINQSLNEVTLEGDRRFRFALDHPNHTNGLDDYHRIDYDVFWSVMKMVSIQKDNALHARKSAS